MENTAIKFEQPIPASELFYRIIGGGSVSGAEILESLAPDISRGYLVGAQTILTLVRENHDVSASQIGALTDMLRRRLAAGQLGDDVRLAYHTALKECARELQRRERAEKIVQLRK